MFDSLNLQRIDMIDYHWKVPMRCTCGKQVTELGYDGCIRIEVRTAGNKDKNRASAVCATCLVGAPEAKRQRYIGLQ
jgi:hypothetical protein